MSGMIPVNSLIRHIEPLADRLHKVAEDVIRSGYFVLGPNLKAFEDAFAQWCGASHCVGVANGTDALELSLKVLGVSQGDRVAVVANAAMYGTSAVLACGAIPVLVDIDPASHAMSAQALADVAAQGGLKAVIVTHLYGRLADMPAILDICERHGIRVLEDCAQAHGAEAANGQRAGTFGDIASFSFYPTKNLGALGDGGGIVTNNAELAARARQLRQYGWSAKYTNELAGGRNSRLDELQAAFLLEMLPEVEAWNARRRDIANRYSHSITNPAVQAPAPAGRDYVAHLYVVRTDQRDSLRDFLLAGGVQTDVHYPVPDYRQPCLVGRVPGVVLDETERAAASILTLPCFPEMTDAEVTTVIDRINAWTSP